MSNPVIGQQQQHFKFKVKAVVEINWDVETDEAPLPRGMMVESIEREIITWLDASSADVKALDIDDFEYSRPTNKG